MHRLFLAPASVLALLAPAALADDLGSLDWSPLSFRPAAPQPPASPPLSTPPAESPSRLRSWELPPVVVEGQPAAQYRADELVGSYAQPRWTTTRRFPSTRVYVIPEGKVEVEAWARATIKRDDQGGNTQWRFLQEVEIGLPHRFQLDLYLREDYDTDDGDTLWGGQFEVRWALADWGKIWGNPALYFEYILLEDRPDKIEPKLLLGDTLAPGWHWATNLVFEFEMGGEREYEYSLTAGISKTIVDEKLDLGVEAVYAATDVHGDRGNFHHSLVIGPSVQWRPVPNATINFAPLFGVTNDSPLAQIYFNAGWEF